MLFLKATVGTLRGWAILLVLGGCAVTAQAACPGDTDWNGQIELADLVRFFHYYHDQDPVVRQLADTNQDGETDISDMSVIFEDYQFGCRSRTKPCPGDTDWDDRIDVGDLVRFFHYYRSNDSIVRLAADVNQDGQTNVADVVTIFDIYVDGCP